MGEVEKLPCGADGCGDGLTRREFVQGTAGCFAMVVAALGLLAPDAAALPVAFTSATAQAGSERRYPIPSSDSVNVDREESTIVARYQGHAYVFSLACPHQNAAVRWLPEDQRFQCTKHGSRYTPVGVYISGRATRNLDRFAVRRDGDSIVANLDVLYQSDKNPSDWAEASITV
ncbi:MAG: ubiquinol-cytochrome c reductase iron-sulfur subunit [Betaproteobacteria bacterium]